jgi:hypothetical protein
MFNEHSSTILNPVGNAMVLPPDKKPGTGRGIDLPVVFFDDFITAIYAKDLALSSESDPTGDFSVVADRGKWLTTLVAGAGTPAIGPVDASPGGAVAFTTGTNALDSIINQLNGEAFKLVAGKTTVMETRVKLSTVDTDWFVGLTATLVTAETNNTDFVGFGNTDATADIHTLTGKDAAAGEIADIVARSGVTATDTGANWAADTYVTLRWEADGVSTVDFFVDGVRKGQHTANICDDVTLTPTIIAKVNAAASGAETMTMDYIYVATER